jgi:hypothetical protein
MWSTTDSTFVNDTPVPLMRRIAFSTRELSPDTPPPRL